MDTGLESEAVEVCFILVLGPRQSLGLISALNTHMSVHVILLGLGRGELR